MVRVSRRLELALTFHPKSFDANQSHDPFPTYGNFLINKLFVIRREP
jgi:hypothetical protein